MIQRDVKLIKTARSVYRTARICSICAAVIASAVICLDVIKTMK